MSKFKAQNGFGHWDFGHLKLFRVSDFGFRVFDFFSVIFPLANGLIFNF
jgi:hypothetical protein